MKPALKKHSKKHSKKRGGSDILSVLKSTDKNYNKALNDIKKEFDPIVKITDIKRELQYKTGVQLLKPQTHIGQRKLFLTELQFLTKLLTTNVKYCIYAGASPSNKTHYLSTLFPEIKFILIDPNKFDIKLPDFNSHRSIAHDDIIHLYYDYKTKSNVYKSNKKENHNVYSSYQ